MGLFGKRKPKPWDKTVSAVIPPQQLRMFYKLKGTDKIVPFDVSHLVCDPFGYYPRDKIQIPPTHDRPYAREATIIGVKDGQLWYHAQYDDGAECWTGRSGRAMIERKEMDKEGFGLLETAGVFDSGLWQGYYARFGQRQPMSMNLVFEFSGNLQNQTGHISGEGEDAHGKYTISGKYKPVTLEAKWTQKYSNGKKVEFVGVREKIGKAINGKWTAGDVACDFHIGPVPKFEMPESEMAAISKGTDVSEVQASVEKKKGLLSKLTGGKKGSQKNLPKIDFTNESLYPNKMNYLVKKTMTYEPFHVSRHECETFGFRPGDKVKTPLDGGREATVVGVRNDALWMHLDGEIGASYDLRKFSSRAEFERAGYSLLNPRRFLFAPPKQRKPPPPIMCCHSVAQSFNAFVWFFLEIFKQTLNYCWMIQVVAQVADINANDKANMVEHSFFLTGTYLLRGWWIVMWYTSRAFSLFFSWTDEIQCPGSRSSFFMGWYLIVLLGIILLLRSDVMLYSGLSILRCSRFKSRGAKVVSRNHAKFVLGFYWFIYQSLAVFVRDGVHELFYWKLKPFTAGVNADGFCNETDNIWFLLSRIFGMILFVAGTFCLSNTTALQDPLAWMLPLSMKSFSFLPMRFIYNLWMNLKLAFGIWTDMEEAGHRVVELGRNYDNDPSDMDNKHEIIVITRSRQACLFWQALPGGLILAKLGECFIAAPCFITSNRIQVREQKYRRFVKAWGNFLKWFIMFVSIFFTHWAWHAAFLWLFVWVLVISHTYEMVEEFTDMCCRDYNHPKIKSRYQKLVEREMKIIPRGPFYYIPPGCTKDADPFDMTDKRHREKFRQRRWLQWSSKFTDVARNPIKNKANRGDELNLSELMESETAQWDDDDAGIMAADDVPRLPTAAVAEITVEDFEDENKTKSSHSTARSKLPPVPQSAMRAPPALPVASEAAGALKMVDEDQANLGEEYRQEMTGQELKLRKKQLEREKKKMKKMKTGLGKEQKMAEIAQIENSIDNKAVESALTSEKFEQEKHLKDKLKKKVPPPPRPAQNVPALPPKPGKSATGAGLVTDEPKLPGMGL